MEEPLVSVNIPAYNAQEFIERTVMSAIKQTYKNIEVIFSDGTRKEIFKPGILTFFKQLIKEGFIDNEGVVLLSEKMRYAYMEAVFNPEEGYSYFSQRKESKLIIYRTNGKVKEIIAEQGNMFIPEAEEFLAKKAGIKLQDGEKERIVGIKNIENTNKLLDMYFNPKNAFIAINPITQKLRPITFKEAGYVVRDAAGKLVIPKTGEILEPTLGFMLIDSAFKQGKEVKLDNGDVIAAPAAKIITPKNGIYYLFEKDLKNLPNLYVVPLEKAIVIPYTNDKKITLDKGTFVTYQKPFAQEIGGKLIPAVVEYAPYEGEYAVITKDEQGNVKYRKENPLLARRTDVSVKSDMVKNEAFWNTWVKGYALDVPISSFKKPVLPRIKIENKMPQKNGVGLKQGGFNFSVVWPQNLAKENEPFWEKTFRVDIFKLFSLDYRSTKVKLENGRLPTMKGEALEGAYKEGKLDQNKIKAETFSYELTKEEGYYPNGWQQILKWKPDAANYETLLEGLTNFGLKYGIGQKGQALTKEETSSLKVLKYTSSKELARMGITREDGVYFININGRDTALNQKDDKNFSRSLVLTKEGRPYFIQLGNRGLKYLNSLEKNNFAKLIAEDGSVIYVPSLKKLPYTIKAKLTKTDGGFVLREAAPRQIKNSKHIVDAVFTKSGKKFLVEYSPYKLVEEIAKGPAIYLHSEVKRVPVGLDLEKMAINYPDFYKIEAARQKELIWEYGPLVKEEIMKNISSAKDSATLLMKENNINHVVSFSPEVQGYFDWADENMPAYQVLPGVGVKLCEQKDLPVTWYPTLEALIAGKETYTKDYTVKIKAIASQWGYGEDDKGTKEFEKRFYDEKEDKGAVFDIRDNGLIIFTEQGKDMAWMIRYQDDQHRLVTEVIRGGKTYFREIIPTIITAINYANHKKEICADTYLTRRPLDAFRNIQSLATLKRRILEQDVINILDGKKEYLLNIFKHLAGDEKGLSDEVKINRVKGILEKQGIEFSIALPLRISHSEVINYNSFSDKEKINLIVEESRKQKFEVPAELSELKWVKINHLLPNGTEYAYEYQAFGKSSLPFAKIIDGKYLFGGNYEDAGRLADIAFDYKGKRVSLRFDLDAGEKIAEPQAIAHFSKYPSENMVIDLYKELLFKDMRNEPEGYWTERLHLKKNGLFDNSWLWMVEHLDEIAQKSIERGEAFAYDDSFYPESLLKASEIASKVVTTYYIYNGETKKVVIGLGCLQTIDWSKGLIFSDNKVLFYKEDAEVSKSLDISYIAGRDWKGNVRVQFFKNNDTNFVLGIYVFNFNKQGIGKKSLVIVKEENGLWTPLETAIFRNAERITYRDIKGKEYKGKTLFFDVTELNKPIPLEFDEKDTFDSYFSLNKMFPALGNVSLISEKYRMGKSGEGKLKLRLDGYRLTKEGNLEGAPLWIAYPLHETDILSATEAGPLHFGYGSRGYAYKYSSEKGFDATAYTQLSLWSWLKSCFGYKIDPWEDTQWKAKNFERKIKDLD